MNLDAGFADPHVRIPGCYPEIMARAGVLIVSRDWRSRALLRAQLLEEGLLVRAYESIRDAATVIGSRSFKPGLLVADISDDGRQNEIDRLAHAVRLMPVWVIAGRATVNEAELRDRGFERVFFRPVGIGELVEAIKQRLAS
jgi:DNA-binding NtrC family response regulator